MSFHVNSNIGRWGPGERWAEGKGEQRVGCLELWTRGPGGLVPTHGNHDQGGSECSFVINGSRKTTRKDKGRGGEETSFLCFKLE